MSIKTINNLEPRPVSELLGMDFFIPSYQRGYRWTPLQVTDLLSDVLEFSLTANKDDFYCLQPIVVKNNEERYEVIDGQQRLTTIFIILNYFNQRPAEDFKKEIFKIKYQTRDGSENFLKNMPLEDRGNNIDFYFMSNAYETVRSWFSDKQNLTNDFESALLNKVEIIWYEVVEEFQEIEIFTRLNMGKIPLTNGELIKALLLKSDHHNEGNEIADSSMIYSRQLEIANQWDTMEKALQNDSFWYFIKDNKVEYDTRIEFIFDRMTNKKQENDEYYTFQTFMKNIRQKRIMKYGKK